MAALSSADMDRLPSGPVDIGLNGDVAVQSRPGQKHKPGARPSVWRDCPHHQHLFYSDRIAAGDRRRRDLERDDGPHPQPVGAVARR